MLQVISFKVQVQGFHLIISYIIQILDCCFHILIYLTQVCARILANCVRQVADSVLLTHDFALYSDALKNALVEKNYENLIKDINNEIRQMNPKPILPTTDQEKIVPTIDFVKMTRELSKSVDTFKKETKQWNRFFDEIGKKNRSIIKYLLQNVIVMFLNINSKRSS